MEALGLSGTVDGGANLLPYQTHDVHGVVWVNVETKCICTLSDDSSVRRVLVHLHDHGWQVSDVSQVMWSSSTSSAFLIVCIRQREIYVFRVSDGGVCDSLSPVRLPLTLGDKEPQINVHGIVGEHAYGKPLIKSTSSPLTEKSEAAAAIAMPLTRDTLFRDHSTSRDSSRPAVGDVVSISGNDDAHSGETLESKIGKSGHTRSALEKSRISHVKGIITLILPNPKCPQLAVVGDSAVYIVDINQVADVGANIKARILCTLEVQQCKLGAWTSFGTSLALFAGGQLLLWNRGMEE